MSKFRFLRSTIYKLKRRFGSSVIFKRIDVSETPDYTTGVIEDQYIESKPVRNVILLPFALSRNFSYDLSYIAANKNFTYGGFYDTDTSTIVCDKRDLKGFSLDLDSWVEINCVRYQVKKVSEAYQDSTVLIIQIIETKGER